MSFAVSVRSFIVENYLGGEEAGLDLDTPLFDLNIIDSSALFDLVQFIGDEGRVEVPLDEVIPENFQSIGAMAQLVERLGGAA